MGAVWITITQAKTHLRIDTTDEDSSLLLKMEEASDIVRGYVTNSAKDDWTDRTVPARIRAAVLLVLGALHGDRGDDADKSIDPLSDKVKNLLRRDRDPAMA